MRATVASDGALALAEPVDVEAGDYDAVVVLVARAVEERAPSFEEPLDDYLGRVRKEYVRGVVDHVGGNRAKAAELLKVTERTVYRVLADGRRGGRR
ncbi:MAG: hypothetical protein HOW73_18100 [Polyangiaceae bacterium]|nr:hypothetical protein [Polyangiaceae bacterium]